MRLETQTCLLGFDSTRGSILLLACLGCLACLPGRTLRGLWYTSTIYILDLRLVSTLVCIGNLYVYQPWAGVLDTGNNCYGMKSRFWYFAPVRTAGIKSTRTIIIIEPETPSTIKYSLRTGSTPLVEVSDLRQISRYLRIPLREYPDRCGNYSNYYL